MGKLTKQIIEREGFKRINNSMWRKGNLTLQNCYTHEGVTLYEKIINTNKAYKLCIKGRYLKTITKECELYKLINTYK